MTSTTDALDALLAIRDGNLSARWNYVDAVGSPLDAPAGIGNAVTLSYSFLSAAPGYFPTAGFAAFSGAARSATGAVLDMISSIIGVDFNEVAGVGTLTFGMNAQSGSAGYAYYPGFNTRYSGNTITSVTPLDSAGDVWLNSNIAWTPADFTPGGAGFGTLVHEIGHALGLKHPFEAGAQGYTLDAAFDNKAWTVMSYSEHPHGLFRTVTDNGGGSYSWRYEYIEPETLMPYDILALQHLYGANTSHRAGNDTYTFDPARPFLRTIWDTGGVDTVSVANFSLSSVIDLRDGHFSSIRILSDALPPGQTDTRADLYDGTDNLAIAFGVTLENATGGAGNDRLTGNQVANLLDGGAGNDTLSGDDGNDSLVGKEGVDTLTGGNGNDLLDGGTSGDSMTGGAGNDRYVVQNSADKVKEVSGGGTDSVSSSITYTLTGYVEKLTLTGSSALNGSGNGSNNTITGNSAINSLGGGDGNDSLVGMEGVDTLTGGNGNDLLDGGTSGDSMTGGAGNDRYVVQNSADKVIEASGGGTDSVSSSITYTLAGHVEKLTLTGSAALHGHGNSLNNTLVGNSGANLLRGSTGNDTLTGGAGLDVFRFSSALNGSTNVDTVTDFSLADDTLQLEDTIFVKLTSTGVLSTSFFRANTSGSASDGNDHILFETDTGKLFYDADGSGAGVKVLFAQLAGNPALTAADSS